MNLTTSQFVALLLWIMTATLAYDEIVRPLMWRLFNPPGQEYGWGIDPCVRDATYR